MIVVGLSLTWLTTFSVPVFEGLNSMAKVTGVNYYVFYGLICLIAVSHWYGVWCQYKNLVVKSVIYGLCLFVTVVYVFSAEVASFKTMTPP